MFYNAIVRSLPLLAFSRTITYAAGLCGGSSSTCVLKQVFKKKNIQTLKQFFDNAFTCALKQVFKKV